MSVARAELCAILAAILFSTGGAGIKAESFSAVQVTAVRSGIAALALLAYTRGRLSWQANMLPASVAYAATLTTFVFATKLTTAANAIFLQSTAPLYLLILGPWLLHERFRPKDLAYLAVVAVGLVLCFAGRAEPTVTAPDPAAGNALALLCSVTWALTLLAFRRLERDGGAGSTRGAVIVGSAIANLSALPFAWPFPPAPVGEWATLVYLGVGQVGLAYVLLGIAIRHLTALEVSLLLLLEPVLNPVWTWLIRGEVPGRWTVTGGALILLATLLNAVAASRVKPEIGRRLTGPP